MPIRPDNLRPAIQRIDALLSRETAALPPSARKAIDRFRADAAAALFHMDDHKHAAPIVALLGGTGTGKSTVVNRLMQAELSAASLRRTYTAGAIAILADPRQLPDHWTGWPHVTASQLPVRGEIDSLLVVRHDADLPRHITLIDTPDLDGDQPVHHAQAERVFRWAQAIVFLVTPEKYQMPELLPFYRLAKRYEIPALFVMNKCEEPAVLDDFAKQLAQRDWPDAKLFAVPRDDAVYEPPAESNLGALRTAVAQLKPTPRAGIERRGADLMQRLHDQVISPQRRSRKIAEQLIAAVRSLQTPPAGVDVNPITQQLQRRLQQRSVLYLMGPQRVLDRVRQVPALLVRLPRTAWDLAMRGELPKSSAEPSANGEAKVPDFQAALADQFSIVRSRIDDVIRSDPSAADWTTEDAAAYKAAWLPPDRASQIATEELADLTAWLEKRWNSQPRDTRAVNTILKRLPGGDTLAKWSEAAPYLLAVVVAAHHAVFGPVDLMILGGFGLATWLSERLSNEVASRTRLTNRRIAQRFESLAAEQIDRIVTWLDTRAMTTRTIEQLESFVTDDLAAAGRQTP